MNRIFFCIILISSIVFAKAQPLRNVNVPGRWNSYQQHQWLSTSSTGFMGDNFFLDKKGNALYEVDTHWEKSGNSKNKHLVKAEGHYQLDSINALLYLCFNKFYYSDSSFINGEIKTVAKISKYIPKSNSVEDKSIAENVPFSLRLPMCKYYISDTAQKYPDRNTRMITDADFDKIELIDWSMDKNKIIEKINQSNYLELLKLKWSN